MSLSFKDRKRESKWKKKYSQKRNSNTRPSNCEPITVTVTAVSHDATSLTRIGFMKPVSPCDRAKNVLQDILKVPCDCCYDRALLYSCNLFRATFPYQPIRFSIISVERGKPTFIFIEHMVTIYILVCNKILASNSKDILINSMTTSKHRSLKNCLSVRGNCLLCLLVNVTGRRRVGIPFSSAVV